MILKYNKIVIIIFMLLLALLLSCAGVSAADNVVSGSDFGSIQSTIDSSSSGDRILLGNKSYSGSGSIMAVNGGKNLTIQGQSNTNRATLNGNS